MRNVIAIPDLTFPSVDYGELETALDLKALLYRGGAKVNAKAVGRMIAEGQLGHVQPERLELVIRIHEVINGRLVGGGSRESAKNNIYTVRSLFTWAEGAKQPLSLGSIEKTYLHWTDSLWHRARVVKEITKATAYSEASNAGSTLDEVLERPTALIGLTRLRQRSQRKTALGVQAEKQNLQETFAFGYLLQDICDGLSVDVVLKGRLPVCIPMRPKGELVAWSGLNSNALSESDGILKTRYPLANLRCEAELLMFIGQTGMNLTQARRLTLRHYFYASHLDGYVVRDRKNRRGGEVLFEIFKDYRPHFERYLEWRHQLFPTSNLLFPFVGARGRSVHSRVQFRLQKICTVHGVGFVAPRALRNTRVNWLLRRSGDPDLTAEMVQSTKETLLGTYERPSLQRAMGEVVRYWSQHDPTLAHTTPVAPGQCDGRPAPVRGIPKNATTPDCIRPSGCLWCENHRDIDSEDYVWSLASFRHLKIIEVSKWRAPPSSRETHPGQHAIDRISAKLRWFHESNARRRGWVEEALARVEEGSYHPDWQRLIEGVEGAP